MENLSLLRVLRRTQLDSPASNEARTHMYVSLPRERPVTARFFRPRGSMGEDIDHTQSPSSPLVVGYLSFGETDWMEPSLKNIETDADDRPAT